MEALRCPSFLSPTLLTLPTKLNAKPFDHHKPVLHRSISQLPNLSSSPTPLSRCGKPTKSKLFTALSTTFSTERVDDTPEPKAEACRNEEKFDWFSHWYPLMPVCDLDKRVPHAKKVMGLDVVVWWDRNDGAWKVFGDSCPHRLAPLSEGRIDQWGRLQCMYHGWCFNGTGDCKFIPQAPRDGPPVHSFKKACASVYPSTVQNEIVWFWPSTDPQYKDIVMKKKPPYIPELDDPSYTKSMAIRDIPIGYEVLIENLMDPAHAVYSHYKLLKVPNPEDSRIADREGGVPLEISVKAFDINGFLAKVEKGSGKFIPPCVFYITSKPMVDQVGGYVLTSGNKKEQPTPPAQKHHLEIFMCVPVSPGNSRLIWTFPRNFGLLIDQVVPRWMFHVQQNLILDSAIYFLHKLDHKLKDVGPSNWQKAFFVPTKSDAMVVAFRQWVNKYSGGQVDWGTKFSGSLPPTPPREQLMNRYWSHVVNCSSCRSAYKGLNVLEVVLQVVSIASIAIVAALKRGMVSMVTRATILSLAVICFAASRQLAHFIYKNFHYHDYGHALV